MAEHRMTAAANVAAVALTVVAFASWGVATTGIDAGHYNDLGLFSAVGPLFWVALVCGVLGFVCAIRALRFRWYVALFALAAVIAVLYATPSVVEGTARVEASFRHLGIADHLARSGHLERGLDAYFNWPGFFAMLGTLQRASGVPEMLALARWAPVVAALAYLPPVLLIARALTPQPRVQWLTAGVFVMVNWTGQDYLSPQTYAFWLLLCIAAVVMTVLRRTDDPDTAGPSARIVAPRNNDGVHRLWVGQEGARVRLSRAQWVTVHVVVVLAVAAIVASHQLTPVMLVLVLFALWLVGRTPHWWLWFGASAMLGIWLVGPAWPFVSGHMNDLVGGIGHQSGAGANLGNRVGNGSVDHHLVVTSRLVQTSAVWMLAGFGTLLLIARRARIRAILLLAAAPFLMVPLQAYGGEMLIRAFLFSLPLVAFLIAVFLFSASSGKAWRGAVLASVLVVLASTTVLTRYGNERGEHFSPQEVATFAWLDKHTAPGATIMQLDQNSPRRWQRYATDSWLSLEDAEPGPAWETAVTPGRLLQAIRRDPAKGPGPAYVVYTRAQQALAELSGNIEPGDLDRTTAEIDGDPRFEVVHRTADSVVWRVR
ncbi:MAG: hypothetical protein ABI873_10935 [Marmoricola sp.]